MLFCCKFCKSHKLTTHYWKGVVFLNCPNCHELIGRIQVAE